MYIEDFSLKINTVNISSDDVFFDIETTGLSPNESFVYLICIASKSEQSDEVRGSLILADSFAEESCLLSEFKRRIEGKTRLIGYNSDRFDLNFLKTRAEVNCFDLGSLPESVDLYKTAKSLKSLLGLPNLQLKTVERACGVNRFDVYGGGELIEVYREYAAALSFSRLRDDSTGRSELEPLKRLYLTNIPTCDYERLRSMLLLHNKEDVTSLFDVYVTLSSLCSFTEGGFKIVEGSVREKDITMKAADPTCLNLNDSIVFEGTLELTIESDVTVPGYVLRNYSTDDLKIARIDDRQFRVEVKILHDELKLFFADYKNYYYFPSEDMVIHKSLASYSNSTDRVPAKKDTCYVRKTGTFVPVFNCSDFEHVLKRSHNDVRQYIMIEDARKDLVKYVSSILKAL